MPDKLNKDAVLEQQLCKACGFCCDGTLFINVRIRESEPINDYKNSGLCISDSNDELAIMKQPCSAFRDQCCQSYHCRPLRCGEFRCSLLKQVAEGSLSGSQALKIIQYCKKLRSEYTEILLSVFPTFRKKALAATFKEIRKVSRRLTGETLKRFRLKKKRLMELKLQLQKSLDENFYTHDTKT